MKLSLYLGESDKKVNNILPESSKCCRDISMDCSGHSLETGVRKGPLEEVTSEVRPAG